MWRYGDFGKFLRELARLNGDFPASISRSKVNSSEGNDAPETRNTTIGKEYMMKHLITAAAILISLGTSTFAMAQNSGLSTADANKARIYVPNGDFSNLTSAQANAIANVLHGDREHVGGEIRSILMWN
jgi:hypothetical protein